MATEKLFTLKRIQLTRDQRTVTAAWEQIPIECLNDSMQARCE